MCLRIMLWDTASIWPHWDRQTEPIPDAGGMPERLSYSHSQHIFMAFWITAMDSIPAFGRRLNLMANHFPSSSAIIYGYTSRNRLDKGNRSAEGSLNLLDFRWSLCPFQSISFQPWQCMYGLPVSSSPPPLSLFFSKAYRTIIKYRFIPIHFIPLQI